MRVAIFTTIALSITLTASAFAWSGDQLARLEQYEQKVLGKASYELAVDERLSQVETRLFGSSHGGSVASRLHAIERKLNPAAFPEPDLSAAKEISKKGKQPDAGLSPSKKASELIARKKKAEVQSNMPRSATGKDLSKTNGKSFPSLAIDSSKLLEKPMSEPPFLPDKGLSIVPAD